MDVARSRLGTAELAQLCAALQELAPAVDEADRIERIRHFETMKAVIAAAQLREAVAFDVSRRADEAAAGVTPERQGRGVAGELALARRDSPWKSRRWLGWGKVLTAELPATFAELSSGRTTEWRALLVARETIWLSRDDRAEVDAALAPQLPRLGDRQVETEARRWAQRLDPAGAVERRRVAERARRVGLRPLPDTMAALTCTHTVERGVAMWARLRHDADRLIGTGDNDGRTRDQLMADLLYERITGDDVALGPAVEIDLLLDADTLLAPPGGDPRTLSEIAVGCDAGSATGSSVGDGCDAGSATGSSVGGDGSHEPAVLSTPGLAPTLLPAPLARELAGRAAAARQAWLRRLFTVPDTGELIAMDSRQRSFTDAQARFIRHRDQYCTTPWCGAPIRHIDHARPVEHGGQTTVDNGNGKCAACNYAKQSPGWSQQPTAAGRGALRTPTGHRYPIRPPSPPARSRPSSPSRSTSPSKPSSPSRPSSPAAGRRRGSRPSREELGGAA